MPVVKGQHYPYTAAGKKAAASARKGMKRGGKPRRSDPERRESVRKRAATAAAKRDKNRREFSSFYDEAMIIPFEMLTSREQSRRIKKALKEAETPSDRYPQGQVDYVRSGARRGTPRAVQRKKGGAVRKYAKGGAVNLNRTIRGPNS